MRRESLLDEALEAWADAREGVIDEVRNLPLSAMAFRPAPASRSVAELVHHIVEVGLMWTGELTRPDGNFRRKPFDRFVAEYRPRVRRYRSRADLLRLLRETHREGARRVREAGELFLLRPITRFDGQEGTRLAWLHHGIAHEEYHRGQIAVYARLLGRVPALTRLIES